MKFFLLPTFLLCLFFSAVNLQAQEKNRSWSISAYYTPQYVDYFRPDVIIDIDIDIKSGPGFSSTLGLEAGIPIQTNTFITIGGAFFKEVGKTSATGLRWGDEHDGMGGWTPNPDNFRAYESKNIATFIQIPIGIQLFFGSKKIQGYLKPGLVGERFLKGKIVTTKSYDDGHEETSEKPFNSPPVTGLNNLLISLGLGGLWNINYQLGLFAEYQSRLDLPNLQADPLLGKRFDLGLRFGVRYGFGNPEEN